MHLLTSAPPPPPAGLHYPEATAPLSAAPVRPADSQNRLVRPSFFCSCLLTVCCCCCLCCCCLVCQPTPTREEDISLSLPLWKRRRGGLSTFLLRRWHRWQLLARPPACLPLSPARVEQQQLGNIWSPQRGLQPSPSPCARSPWQPVMEMSAK